jgi:hypothetical protein
MIPSNYYLVKGRTPYEIVNGDTPDISEYSAFTWYEPVWCLDTTSYPQERKKLGRWLGVLHRVGQAMCCNVISRTSVEGLSQDETKSETVIAQITSFDAAVNAKKGDHLLGAHIDIKDDPNILYILDEEDKKDEPFDERFRMPDDDNIPDHAYDNLLQVMQPLGYVWTLPMMYILLYGRVDRKGLKIKSCILRGGLRPFSLE